ncbi:MAG: helix-turn-helix domain-containing protein [Oscillospiraceae bacterium]|jgi:transcriptional regulator with XRE-family HTH domain|nr:helix-turn-helix domain-containing protein [Oscillospiraceae bacterium]
MMHQRIRALREQRDLLQTEVSKYLNVTREAYSMYETGKRQMNYETLCLLADFFEVSTDYLLGRVEAVPSYLSGEERFLIEQYRALDRRGKDTIKAALAFEKSQ